MLAPAYSLSGYPITPPTFPVVTAANLGLHTSLDGGLDEMNHMKHLAKYLTHSKTSANISYYCYFNNIPDSQQYL